MSGAVPPEAGTGVKATAAVPAVKPLLATTNVEVGAAFIVRLKVLLDVPPMLSVAVIV